MTNRFIAPCAEHYGCSQRALSLYSKNGHNLEFLHCDDCGLIWKDSLKCPDDRTYDAAYFAKQGYKERKAHRIRKSHLLFEIIEASIPQPGTMLEIGPGMGEAMECARQRGWQVQGLDISDFAIAECAKDGFDVKKGSLEGHSLDQKYDLLFMKHVLEHYRDPFKALKEAGKLLNDGGLLFTVVPDARYPQAEKLRNEHRFYRYEDNGVEHHVYFNAETLRRALMHSGFDIVQEGMPAFIGKGDSAISFFNRNIRNIIPIFGKNREVMMLGRKRD